jgi:hypothetical protein
MLKFIERTFTSTPEMTKAAKPQASAQCELDSPYLSRDGYVVKEISFEEFARAFQKYSRQGQHAA